MREILSRPKELLLGAVIGAIISLLLWLWLQHQPGTLILEIELPPLFAPHFSA